MKQSLFLFILYIKHVNVVIYNTFMLNWKKNAFCVDVIFIAFYINETLGHEIKYLIMEEEAIYI